MAVRQRDAERPDPGAAEAPGRLSRREQQRLATRERIYETALAEFERVGFSEAQIDRIVEKAGVARGTFYFHFQTKEHVLIELQHRVQDEVVSRIAALGDPPTSVKAFCRRVYDTVMQSGEEHPSMRREVMAMYVRQNMGVELGAEPLIVHVVDYFADAAERGSVRRDIPPERLAVHFLSSMFVHYTGEGDEQQDEFVDNAIDIFARGVAA